MKRFLCGIALTGLILALSSEATSAQMHGMVKYPAIGGVGVKIFGDFAKGLNDDSFKNTYFGGRAELGIPVAQFWAGAGSAKPQSVEGFETSSSFTWGAGAAFNLIKGVSPIKVAVQASYGSVSDEGASLTHIPLGVSVAADLGTGGTAVKPFGYVYVDYTTAKSGIEGDESIKEWGYGITGGLELNLAMGLGLQAALDFGSYKSESPIVGDENRLLSMIVNVGVSYKISVPSLGM